LLLLKHIIKLALKFEGVIMYGIVDISAMCMRPSFIYLIENRKKKKGLKEKK